MPVNLNRDLSQPHNSELEDRDRHHGNESPCRNFQRSSVASTQVGRTPEQWPQDRSHINSRVGGHIGFGGASHVHIPCESWLPVAWKGLILGWGQATAITSVDAAG